MVSKTQSPPPATRIEPSAPLAGLRLLVIEESGVSREVLRRVLTAAGARVETVGEGPAAVARLRSAPEAIDAVLIALPTPGGDGLAIAKAIRAQLAAKDIPLIGIAADERDVDRPSALAAGIDALVVKSSKIDFDAIIAALVARRRQASRQSRPLQPANEQTLAPETKQATLPGIDLASALVRVSGNRELLASLLTRFVAAEGASVAKSRALLAEGKVDDAMNVMHRLRGIAATLGAVEVAGLALRTEAAIRERQPWLEVCLNQLASALRTVAASSHALASVGEKASPVPLGKQAGERGLRQLAELLARHDLKAEERFEALRSDLAAAVGESTIEEIARSLQNLDFARAAELLEQVAKRLKA